MAFLEPIIGAVAAFMLGFGWYTFAFGKIWQTETGLSDEDVQGDMLRTHGLAFLMMIILCYAVNMIIGYHAPEEQTFTHGAFHGALAALFYAVPAMAINYLYQRRSLKLFLIDASYVTAFLALAGGIMAALTLG